MFDSLLLPFRQSPWPALFSGLLAGIIVTCGLQYVSQQQRQQLQDLYYGKALATMASRQAVDATLNHDLVSLQVILRDIAQNPRVETATIRDVENHLLVQAGAAPDHNETGNSLEFTAPITFHDTISGYVAVTLSADNNPAIDQPSIAALVLCLCGLLISLLRNTNPIPEAEAQTSSEATAPLNPAPAEDPAKLADTGQEAVVELRLHLLNLNKLARQISTTLLRQLLHNLQQHITDTSRLYGGQLVQTDAESLCLRFNASDTSTARLNAICSARLICELHNQHTGIHLQIAATLVGVDLHAPLWKQLGKVAQRSHDMMPTQLPAGVLLITRDLAEDATAESQINLSLLNDHWYIVTELQPPYCDLLDKQLQHLQHRLAPMMDS